MPPDHLAEIRERWFEHDLVYERPERKAACWEKYRAEGRCGCNPEADFDWLLLEVERLRELLHEAADYIQATDAAGEAWGEVAREAERERDELLVRLRSAAMGEGQSPESAPAASPPQSPE